MSLNAIGATPLNDVWSAALKIPAILRRARRTISMRPKSPANRITLATPADIPFGGAGRLRGRPVSVDTSGSGFDTLLGVYTGSSIGSLTAVASNDDSGAATTSAVTFTAAAGTEYWIAVDGKNGAIGSVSLNLSFTPSLAPANDAFANATVISGLSAQVIGNNINATKEPGEPDFVYTDGTGRTSAGGKSVWWKWTAPAGGQVFLSTGGTNFDTLLSVYTGTAVNALTWVASDDDPIDTYNDSSTLTFSATGGTTYWISVDGCPTATSVVPSGAISLSLNLTPNVPMIAVQPTAQTPGIRECGDTGGGRPWRGYADLSMVQGRSRDLRRHRGDLYNQFIPGNRCRLLFGGSQQQQWQCHVERCFADATWLSRHNQPAGESGRFRGRLRNIQSRRQQYYHTHLPMAEERSEPRRWRERISGSTGATLTISNSQVADSGSYMAVVTNGSGSTNSATATLTVIPILPSGGVVAISAGYSHDLLVSSDGSLWAVGDNTYGQLGDGTIVARNRLVKVATGVGAASAGGSHSVFLKPDGTLWGMGSNSDGQLGDGVNYGGCSSPVQIATGVVAVSAGSVHNLFIKSDGTLWAMGANGYGQLGDGSAGQVGAERVAALDHEVGNDPMKHQAVVIAARCQLQKAIHRVRGGIVIKYLRQRSRIGLHRDVLQRHNVRDHGAGLILVGQHLDHQGSAEKIPGRTAGEKAEPFARAYSTYVPGLAVSGNVYLRLIGAEQAGLNFASKAASDTVEAETTAQTRPAPLPPLLTPEEEAAHTAFVATLGEKAIGTQYLPKNEPA